jgi:hypothetical protein
MEEPQARQPEGARRRWSEPLVVLTAIYAGATIIYTIATIALWYATHESIELSRAMFTAINRPIIGVNKTSVTPHEAKQNISIVIELKNFGNIVARDVYVEWELLVQGVPLPSIVMSDKPSVYFPQVTGELVGLVGQVDYSGVLDGTRKLEYTVNISYSGVLGQQHHTYERGLYITKGEGLVTGERFATSEGSAN